MLFVPSAFCGTRVGTRDNRFMAAGDPQRVWFGQMLERLRDQWHPEMSFGALISLRDDLDAMLQRLRREGNISSPVFKCRDCGYVGPAATPHVSVRAMVLSLARFGIAPAGQIRALEKQWAAYRKQNDLNLYGKRTASPSAENSPCTHA